MTESTLAAPPISKTLSLIVLVATSLILYSQSFRNDFVWDSADAICQDASIRDIRNIPNFFTQFYHASINPEGNVLKSIPYYRPLLKTYRTLQYMVFGQNPVGYNTMNITWNALVVVLAFQLIHAMTGMINVAFLASLLYAVNPTRVEAVSWVISDCYILVAFLALAALLSYHQGKYLMALALYSATLFIHEQSIQFAAVIVIYELTMREKLGLKNLLQAAPFVGVTTLYLGTRLLFSGALPPTASPLPAPFSMAVVVLKRYLKIFFSPDALITVYEKQSFPFTSGELILSLALLVTLFFVAVWLFRKRSHLALFWYAWFFIWISLPIASTMTNRLGEFLMADKGIYLSSLGLCFLVAWSVVSAPEWSKKIVYVGLAALILFHSTYTFARTKYWKSETVYFEKAYEFVPNFYMITDILGRLYAKQNKYDEAQRFFERTIALDPRNSLAYSDLGNVLYLKGDTLGAKQAWEKAARADDANPIPYYNLGMLHENDGDIAGAAAMYRRYLALAKDVPNEVRTHIATLEAMNGSPK